MMMVEERLGAVAHWAASRIPTSSGVGQTAESGSGMWIDIDYANKEEAHRLPALCCQSDTIMLRMRNSARIVSAYDKTSRKAAKQNPRKLENHKAHLRNTSISLTASTGTMTGQRVAQLEGAGRIALDRSPMENIGRPKRLPPVRRTKGHSKTVALC